MAKRPYLKLRRLIEDEGLELQELAEQTGIPRSTLYEHLGLPENAGKWSWKEIVIICTVLRIPSEKIGEYFFPRLEKEDKTA